MGTLHGGVLCDIADAPMGVAYASTLDGSETFTTLELKINFLRPVWTGKLGAVGHVVKRGRSVGLVECDVTDDKGRLVARASSTCLALRGDQAQGGVASRYRRRLAWEREHSPAPVVSGRSTRYDRCLTQLGQPGSADRPPATPEAGAPWAGSRLAVPSPGEN